MIWYHKLKMIMTIAKDLNASELIKDLNVVSIPRYLLIDKDGKIISADALRPSDEILMSLLSSYK